MKLTTMFGFGLGLIYVVSYVIPSMMLGARLETDANQCQTDIVRAVNSHSFTGHVSKVSEACAKTESAASIARGLAR
ncbi:hypothetical protein SKTS_13760 [Sulfurimicrobium lacus]|uniref:Uncharacterized protein n=1 Tax=Sulfurimicrobium lacus TaxID=2715678 RepID=A0A6F8VAY2_9PROT|nr:hypothetical protein SKTS_13760 [Sulfurimicrobium lacus]